MPNFKVEFKYICEFKFKCVPNLNAMRYAQYARYARYGVRSVRGSLPLMGRSPVENLAVLRSCDLAQLSLSHSFIPSIGCQFDLGLQGSQVAWNAHAATVVCPAAPCSDRRDSLTGNLCGADLPACKLTFANLAQLGITHRTIETVQLIHAMRGDAMRCHAMREIGIPPQI